MAKKVDGFWPPFALNIDYGGSVIGLSYHEWGFETPLAGHAIWEFSGLLYAIWWIADTFFLL